MSQGISLTADVKQSTVCSKLDSRNALIPFLFASLPRTSRSLLLSPLSLASSSSDRRKAVCVDPSSPPAPTPPSVLLCGVVLVLTIVLSTEVVVVRFDSFLMYWSAFSSALEEEVWSVEVARSLTSSPVRGVTIVDRWVYGWVWV